MNTIYCGNCVDVMREKIKDESIDLTVTSPPYDSLRDYKGYTFDFEAIAQQLYRVTKKGGIVVWVVADETKNFCESLTSFKQALYFVETCRFKLLDTMIYQKNGKPPKYPNLRRYANSFEYMFIFSKEKPNTFKAIRDVKNKLYGEKRSSSTVRLKNNNTKENGGFTVNEFGERSNIWLYNTNHGSITNDIYTKIHPARFPEQLAHDHILSWSNENDIVLDPMCGSGTTLKMAKGLNRRYIGIDISQEYVDLSNKRVDSIEWGSLLEDGL